MNLDVPVFAHSLKTYIFCIALHCSVHTQGKRTATNLAIPFVCVGRRMTHENRLPAVAPTLLEHRAQHGLPSGVKEGGGGKEAELTRLLVGAAAARKEVQLEKNWAQQMVTELGLR